MNNYNEVYSDIDKSTGSLLDHNHSQTYYNSMSINQNCNNSIQQSNKNTVSNSTNLATMPIINPQSKSTTINPQSESTTINHVNKQKNNITKLFLQLTIIGLGAYVCIYIIKL